MKESKSAEEPGRPEFDRMIALIDKGQIDGIVGWHPDRLSRNEMDAAAITMRLRKGILKDLDFAQYFFHNSPEGIMMLQMALSQSQYQVSKLSIDVKRGIDDKLKKGWYPHRAPLGYVNDKHLDKGQKTISPDPERFDVLKKAWDLLLTGSYSVPRVLDILNNDWGLRTPVTRSGRGGEAIARTTLYRLFANVFYAGYFVHDGTIYKGAHTAMVSLEEFDRAQKIIGNDNPLPRRSHELPFTGLIRCARCTGQVTADVVRKPSGRTYTYYHCQGANGCTKRGVPQDKLEAMIDAELAQMDLLPEFYAWAIEDIEQSIQQERAQQKALYDQRLRVLHSTDQMLDELLGMRMRNLVTDEEYLAKRNQLTLERARLHEEAQQSELGADRARESCLNAAEFMKNAREWLRHGDAAMKRIVAMNLGSNYLLKEGKIVLESHPMLVKIKEEYKTLEAEYEAIKLDETLSQSQKKQRLDAVRSTWSGIWDVNRTRVLLQDLRFPDVAVQIETAASLGISLCPR